jgi:hypothetical protein
MSASDKDTPPKTESIRGYERGSWLGLTLLIGGGVLYILAVVFGVAAESPEAMLGVIALSGLMSAAGVVILFFKAIGDRLGSREDNYYSKNVDH